MTTPRFRVTRAHTQVVPCWERVFHSLTRAHTQVIPCWERAFITMKVGERALVKCDPKSAYGRKGMPPHIPPEATLKFDIELLGVTSKP